MPPAKLRTLNGHDQSWSDRAKVYGTLDLFVPRPFEPDGPIDAPIQLNNFFEALMNMDAISVVAAAERESIQV